jgi:hypothetical protein
VTTEFTKKEGPAMSDKERINKKPGVCMPWEEKRKEIDQIKGDEQLFKQVWEEADEMAYTYIWHLLVSF